MFKEIKLGIKKKKILKGKKEKAGKIQIMYDMRTDSRHSISTPIVTATIYRPR